MPHLPAIAPTGLISASSLAERWDCARGTIYKMIERKELPSIRVGGMVRVPLSAVIQIEEGPCPDHQEDTGSSPEERAGSGNYAGPRIVESGPEALAREMKRRRGNISPGS